MTATGTFPFGAPVRELAVAPPVREVGAFVLGAYPSAVHVEWMPPSGLGRRVRALPVDNEPYPFWDGSGMDHFVERWRTEHFRPEWGEVRPTSFNGSSGREIQSRWLAPLDIAPDQAFITDCLDTSMMSNGVESALNAVYRPLGDRLGLPDVDMKPHPSESAIVRDAQRERLARQIAASDARTVVTLGNAAARVVAEMSGHRGGQLVAETYLATRTAVIEGREIEWHALIHPASGPGWQRRHDEWVTHHRRHPR